MNKLTTSLEFMMANLEVRNHCELFSVICEKAIEKGYILSDFCGDLIEREKIYPTGLETVIPIAIPHVGTNCVQSFFSLATLKDPIEFNNMADPDETLSVKIVFLFGIVDPSEQVDILRKLSEIFQKKEILEAISAAEKDMDLMDIMKRELEDFIA